MISILIVDDINIIRLGTKRLLDDIEDFKVVATAESGEHALTLVEQYHPDVVLMDISMPGMGGIEATRRLRRSYPDLPVIILSVHDNVPVQNHLLKSGVSCYLNKDCPIDEIVTAIRKAHGGGHYATMHNRSGISEKTPIDLLSKREFQVLQMLIDGRTIKHISDNLSLSPKTVSTYRARLLKKLQVTNDAELAKIAIQYGMV
jgi:two-component system invasion response regulator UvrY